MTVPRLNPAGRFNPDLLFRPHSVAVIGASTEAGAQISANLSLGAFRGTVRSVETAADLTAAPDLAVLAGAPPTIAPALEVLAAAGCYAALVPGPAEGLAEAARATGVRVLGPRSFGLAVPAIGLNASRAHIPPPPGRLGLVSQSAALCRTVIDWAGPNGVGFSHIVGVGGNADIGFSLVLDWLSRDPNTGAILLDIRRLKDRRAFLSAARAAARLRPVVAIRAGVRLLDGGAGEAELAFEAALRRAGVLSVRRLEDLLAAAETLSRARPARGEALAIVTNSIGAGRLAADAALLDGLPLAQLANARHGMVHVPLEAAAQLAATAGAVAAAPEVGGVLVVHAPAGTEDAASIDALVAAAPSFRVPLLVCAMGETTGALHRATLVKAGLAAFATPALAVRGFQHLVRDRRNRAAARELPPSAVLSLAPDRTAVRRLFAQVRRAGRLTLFQDEALDVLAAYGIPGVPTRWVAQAEDAPEAAALLGFPVVVKLRLAVPPRDRPPGALALDLHDADEARAAARLLVARQLRRARSAAGTRPDAGILVQRQMVRARELSVRVADDATFGPVIAIGPGGTATDGTEDLAMDLPPLNLPLAHGLIGRCHAGARLGQALRDLPAADEQSVAEILVRISQLMVDWPEIAALEVPALFSDASGATAADAWLRLRAADEPPAVLAIAPYPSELVELWSGGGAESFVIRPIRPEDAEQHGLFFRRLPAMDVRYRFFSTMRELSQEQTARLTQVDYDREMAFLAVREATGETVGVARLVRELDRRSGEFAVIVQPDVKGHGLASHLMHRLIDWARQCGMAEVVGQVLAENAPMLAFVRHLGFSLRRMPEEPDVIEARLVL
ncbi:MAG TPA: GNAT family N-acetyltransferase [Acetobacteraceae bacterium]|jgi:acetyltransferase|nr:GNAT family N-acetyltransferase [Acetobacteraceae bacterium]